MKLLTGILFILILIRGICSFDNNKQTVIHSEGSDNIVFIISEISPAGRTYYDYQSNGISREINMDANMPLRIHAVFNWDTVGNYPGFPDRRVRYFFSDDQGMTWSNLNSVTGNVQSGFPCVTNTFDGRAIVLCNSSVSGGNPRTEVFVDSSTGTGLFHLLDPGMAGGNIYPVWPIGVLTNNTDIVFLGGSSNVYRNKCTSLVPPGTFTGYISISNTGNTNIYSISSGGNKVGIAYITGSGSAYPPGCVFFMESSDNGNIWGPPVQIWNANYSTDSIGGFRGVDVVYAGSSPKVVFDLCKRTESSYFPNAPSKLMFWAPDVNGGVAKVIDSSGGLSGSNPANDGFTSVCRGVIGGLANYPVLCAAWCKASNDTDAAGNNYFDIWVSVTENGGGQWFLKTNVTRNPGWPIRDCRYISISQSNVYQIVNRVKYFMLYQSDSVPGSYVNGSSKSLAKMMYVVIEYTSTGLGKRNETVIPQNYTLFQNYPNPFNPSTTIEYGLSKSANVKLTVYDIMGKEVKTLVQGFQSAGYHSAVFETIGLASGVYFYRIEISDGNKLVFTEAKKMLMVK